MGKWEKNWFFLHNMSSATDLVDAEQYSLVTLLPNDTSRAAEARSFVSVTSVSLAITFTSWSNETEKFRKCNRMVVQCIPIWQESNEIHSCRITGIFWHWLTLASTSACGHTPIAIFAILALRPSGQVLAVSTDVCACYALTVAIALAHWK